MKIIYFAPIDWDFISQRPQHIAKRLSKDLSEFIYIQPFGLRNLKLSDFHRIIKRLAALFRQKSTKKIQIKNCFFIPIIDQRIQKINTILLKRQIRKLADNKTIIWVALPSVVMPDLLSDLSYKALVYEMMDDFPEIHSSKADMIRKTETWLVNKADMIITTSHELQKKAIDINSEKDVELIGNGVDYDFFCNAVSQKPAELEGMNQTVGYIGTIEDWIDFDTIAYIANQREDLDFVFVGPIRVQDVPVNKNIHFLGLRNYEEIPFYCRSFDVCIIPFKISAFADSINPVKLYEYFSLGKAVVAYEMKELKPFGDLLYLASDKHEFLQQLDMALHENDASIKQKRKEIAKQHDWSIKTNEIIHAFSKF